MGGLQGVPTELYEAAAIDGAGFWMRLRRITIPQLMPVIFVTTTLSAVWTFNSFQTIWPLTRGGPVDAARTLVVMTYETAFGGFDMGRGSALATITFAVLIIFSVVYWRRVKPQ
jgi:multiple sugar transport system permease protein